MILSPVKLNIIQSVIKADRVKIRLFSRKRIDRVRAAMFVAPDVLLVGETVRYSRVNKMVLFVTKDMRASNAFKGVDSCLYIPRWWIYAAELVLSPIKWERAKFVPCDGVERVVDSAMKTLHMPGKLHAYPDSEGLHVFRKRKRNETEDILEPGARIVPRAWNHEHCEICYGCICESCGPWGYIMEPSMGTCANETDDDEWICDACYNNYVAQKNLQFNVPGG